MTILAVSRQLLTQPHHKLLCQLADRHASAADEQLDGPVLALLTTAQQQQTSGDFNGAASSLECAQRIAPREPQVLYRLAEGRLAQGDAAQAEQLAQRGLSYSNGRLLLQAGLWDLIARARTQQGNTSGAQEAPASCQGELVMTAATKLHLQTLLVSLEGELQASLVGAASAQCPSTAESAAVLC